MKMWMGRPYVGPLDGTKVEYGSASWNNSGAPWAKNGSTMENAGGLAEQLAPIKAVLDAMLEEKGQRAREAAQREREDRAWDPAGAFRRRLLADCEKLFET